MFVKRSTVTAVLAIVMGALMMTDAQAMEWDAIQAFKRECLESAARNAMAQQKTGAAAPVPLTTAAAAVEGWNVTTEPRSDAALAVRLSARPLDRNRPATEVIRLTLPEPVDMIARHSGLAMTVGLIGETSPEVRLGVRLIGADGTAVIRPVVPASSAWGDTPHEVYFDWAFINYRDAEDAVKALRAVHTIEITAAAQRRAPRRGPSDGLQPAAFLLSDVRLVDYLGGSFDPSRNRWRAEGRRPDLTLQHRCQEITGIVARFGGAAGRAAAIASLDHAARTQCWDGSFLDGRRGARTVASGEYTFGFTLYGLLCGYETLEKAADPALDETIALGPITMTRRAAYRRMFYRGAMARTAALPSQYRDDIIGGDTLMTGANRVLGYAIAMRMIADQLADPERAEVLEHYRPIMRQIADAQGAYSGGFPVLGEGNRYDGRGIHYDGGYTRTHMDWLVNGVIRTGDPLLVQMLRRYQTVFEAAMNAEGRGLKKLISERHPGGGDVSLILPHATYQVGVKHNLPIIAQWGYNAHQRQWGGEKVGNHFTFASHAEGYRLGAHVGVLFDDLAVEPVPADLGYRFPRQFPIWSSRLYTKAGELTHTSRITIAADGETSDDFRIEVGEYPVTVGVPVRVRPSGGAVHATAVSLTGWPTLLPDDATVTFSGDVAGRGRIGEPLPFILNGPARILITGPAVTGPPVAGGETVDFAAALILEPETPGTEVTLTVLNGTD